MYVLLEEQETIINIQRSEQGARIWTSDTTMMTKLDKMVAASENYQLIKVGKFEDGNTADKEYLVTDKTLISFRSAKVKRELAEEQKKAIAERLRNNGKGA